MASLPQPERKRLPVFIGLGMAVLGLSFILFSQTSLNLDFIQPDNPQQTLVFAALSALIFLLFVVLTFILARNLFKLYAERRMGVLGSRFRTRMVVGALILSFLPVIFMFQFAYVLMNRSIDKWFSGPVEALKEDSERLSLLLSDYAATNAQGEAKALASNPELQRAVSARDDAAIRALLERHGAAMEGGFVLLRIGHESLRGYHTPASVAEMATAIEPALQASGPLRRIQWKETEYLAGSESLGADARIYVAMPLPAKLAATMKSIEANHARYYELGRDRRNARRLFMQQLLLITVLVLFAATWLSLFVARLVTQPVAALAFATNEISQGHLDYRVQVRAADELGELVTSFNRMAAELENNRVQIEQSRRDLADTNMALTAANDAIEQRRREIETILQNVPTGVLSLDSAQRVTHTNASFSKMFSREGNTTGSTVTQLFDPIVAHDLERLLRRADRMGTSSREMQIKTENGELHVEVTAASLQHDRQRMGYVIVFEDLSDLLHAQKQVAWREVARRVAHEIKNPLTPIALSAERIRRHLERHEAGVPFGGNSLAVIESCAETISGAVETVRTLVDEFSTLARFPTAQPQPTNINHIVDSALALFHERLDGISVRTDLDPNLPDTLADPEGIKRVIANLVDNAAEAMRDSMVKEIHIRTSFLADADHHVLEISVSDTGHGVTDQLKEKLFLPYFSTKDRGTGLGLAIVSRIVEEHRGSVRVEKNQPMGARFIIELPLTVAPKPKPESTHA
ncbi:MAG TPA: ATP-binding protein [Terriglobales bacterium]|nr:ATP-binding protein [Terriglobales bacterium]